MSKVACREVHLLPGDYSFGGSDLVIRTVLGSCVAVTFWHPRTCMGGMCHFLLPTRREGATEQLSGRYCDEAILLLLREIMQVGQPLREYQVKCFGGASVLTVVEPSPKFNNVATNNVEKMWEILHILGIQPKAEDVGGSRARTIELRNASGDVFVRTPTRLDEEELASGSRSPARTPTTRKRRTL